MLTLKELSEKLGEPYEGDGSITLERVAEITSAKEGDLSFVANPKYVSNIPNCKASALIIPTELETDFRPVIRSANPYLTFTKALRLFHDTPRRASGGVHPTSHVAPSAVLGMDVTVMAHVNIEEGAIIGDRSILYPGVYVGVGARLGNETFLYPHVTIADGCVIGDRTILHAGCRIGSQTPGGDALLANPPVELGADLELGANVVVAGGLHRTTRIGDGAKIDNLVQIGEGTQIGPHCIIIAQVTIGEGVEMGEQTVIAGQVVISPGISIGSGVRVGAQSVVVDDVPPKSIYWGSPAQPHQQEKRLKANIARLPKLFEKIQRLEDKK